MMHSISAAFLFLLMSIPRSNAVVESLDFYGIEKDLTDSNILCTREKCEKCRYESLWNRDCHCGKHCILFGTCCLDSFYASAPQPKLKPTCRSVYKGHSYFIVDHCSSPESVWASLCNSEWDGESDLLKIVPVTSIYTTISYKNYYCFRCHEATDEFLYWTVKFENNFKRIVYDLNENSSLIYNKDLNTWMYSSDIHTDYYPVNITVITSNDVDKLIHECVLGVISDCSDRWSDEEVRGKCQSYMAMKEVTKNGTTVIYKNIHCALCNFESLNSISCRTIWPSGFGGSFSFSNLLDINRSDGELVGKVLKCTEDYLWDPFSKKCRKLTCAVPEYVLKNGKCVPG